MKRIPVLTVVIFLLAAFSSCKNKTGLFIPAEAVAVVHINPASLSSKVSWDEIKNSDWFKEMHRQADDSLAQKILDNPEAAGVDTKGDFVLFFAQRGRNGYTLFEGSVKDAAAFEAANKKFSKKDKVETDGGYSIISMDNSGLVAWNNKKFAYINGMPGMGSYASFGNMSNGVNTSVNFGADSLRLLVKNVLNSEGKSLHDDDRFESLLKESGDVHFWFNSSSMFSAFGGGYTDMMKVGTLIQGNASGTVLSFDDGKITIKAKSFVNKELAKLMEKYDSKNISADVLSHIPSQNVVGVIAANMNPQTVREILKAAGFDGLINSALSKQNITLDEIISAINGQFVFAVSDLHMKDTIINLSGQSGEGYKVRNPDAHILFATGVANQSVFQKIFNIATETTGPAPFPYKLTSQWFVAAKEQSSVDGFLSGATVKQPWADKITGHPFGMYVDLQKILRSGLAEDSAAKAFMLESANVWQDVVGTGGEMKNGVSTGEFVVNMVDKKTNSLKQLNAYINRANAMRKATMRRYTDEEMLRNYQDSSTTVPGMTVPPAVDSAN